MRAQKLTRSTSLGDQHATPTPWPLNLPRAEGTCSKVDEVRVKALVHFSQSSPARNDVPKDLLSLQLETAAKSEVIHDRAQNLRTDTRTFTSLNAPVVSGCMTQDCN